MEPDEVLLATPVLLLALQTLRAKDSGPESYNGERLGDGEVPGQRPGVLEASFGSSRFNTELLQAKHSLST